MKLRHRATFAACVLLLSQALPSCSYQTHGVAWNQPYAYLVTERGEGLFAARIKILSVNGQAVTSWNDRDYCRVAPGPNDVAVSLGGEFLGNRPLTYARIRFNARKSHRYVLKPTVLKGIGDCVTVTDKTPIAVATLEKEQPQALTNVYRLVGNIPDLTPVAPPSPR